MLNSLDLNSQTPFSENRGNWLSAKIYSDVKGNCPCGGKYVGRKLVYKIDMPCCDRCQGDPAILRIRAKIIDESGAPKPVTIRHNKKGERLTLPYECMTVLDTVAIELKEKRFRARDYDSQASRDEFLFENFSAEYLEFHEKRLIRGELTHYGHKHKEKYIKVLREHFTGTDIANIDGPAIILYFNSFTEKFSNRNHSTGELKSILKHAWQLGKIQFPPPFPKIPGTNIRESVLTMADANEIVQNIKEPMYQLMISLLVECALRPCEVRAIQFRDFNWDEGKFYIKRHFSGSVLTTGRKSIRSGKNSVIKFDINPSTEKWVKSQGVRLDSEEFIFKSPNGNPVYENTLPKAWARTLKTMGRGPVQMYEARHAKGTDVLEKSNGNMTAVMHFLGHSNITTTQKRYTRPDENNGQFQESVVLEISR